MSRAVKKKKSATIDDIEAMALKGKDTDMYFSKPKRMPPREVHKISASGDIVKVNVDLTEPFLRELDAIAIFLNISRQAVMKMFLKDGVDRHFVAKQARKASGE
ncbi:MAG: hypothetical protein WCO71_02370 [Pseudomonadota bacterium]